MYTDDELDDRYEVERPESKRSLVIMTDEDPINLAELLEAIKGHDPSKVFITYDFDVPDYVRLQIEVVDG